MSETTCPRKLPVIVFAAILLFVGCKQAWRSEASRQVAYYGCDYYTALREAATDDDALRHFFLFGLLVDAAGSEQYSWDLTELLALVGEDRFAYVLGSTKRKFRDLALDNLWYDGGFDQQGGCKRWSVFQEKYPLVSRMMEEQRQER